MPKWKPTNECNPEDRVRLTLCPEAKLRRLLEAAAKASDRPLSYEALHRIRMSFANEAGA